MNKKSRDIFLLALSTGTSTFGSAMSMIFIPLLIYTETHNPLLTSFQVAINAIGNIFACQLINRLKIAHNDKQALIRCNVILSIVILSAILIPKPYFIIYLYLLTFFVAILGSIARGYYESLIGSICSDYDVNRQYVVAKCKTFENIGTILGSCITGPLLMLNTYYVAFLIDFSSYLAAACISIYIYCNGYSFSHNTKGTKGISILFSDEFKNLSVAHGFTAGALFLMNGSVIYVMKDYYHVQNAFISFYYVSQFIFGLLGSVLILYISKNKKLSISNGQVLRLAYLLPFFIIGVTDNLYLFILCISLLATVHSFSIPLWQSFFQDCATDSSQLRLIGTARKTFVSIIGAVASLIAGVLLLYLKYQYIYLIAALCCFISYLYSSTIAKKQGALSV